VKSAGVFKCPDDSTTAIAGGVPISYGDNSNINSSGDGAIASFSSPANTVLLFEAAGDVVTLQPGEGGDFAAPFTAPATNLLSASGRGLLSENSGYPNGEWGGGNTISYATGDLGGRGKLNNGAGSIARHTNGSNFLAADGHAKWSRSENVSSGTDAKSSDCQQDTSSTQPTDCSAPPAGMAAGTGSGKYALTFSAI
jgi:prepilin-type processing-associated H-X9-DG protein